MIASDYLDELFESFPPGQSLLAKVREFYGPAFLVRFHDEPDGTSHFALDTGEDTLKFREAVIDLNTTTERVKAAATHELLHLCLPIRGYNLINALDSSNEIEANDFSTIYKTMTEAINVVQHDIFVGEFVATGLPLSQFLGRRVVIPQYELEAKRARGKALPPTKAWLGWSWWAFEFLNNYISINHGDRQAETLAKNAAKWGDRPLPGFERHADEIRQWVASGRHLQPDTYMDAVQRLGRLLHLPVTWEFCSLKPIAGEAPLVEQL